MIYLEFISMVRIVLELKLWNMLLFQMEGNLALKKKEKHCSVISNSQIQTLSPKLMLCSIWGHLAVYKGVSLKYEDHFKASDNVYAHSFVGMHSSSIPIKKCTTSLYLCTIS